MKLERVDRILSAHGNEQSQLIGILQDIQSDYNYLPQAALRRVAEKLDISLSRVYSVVTFFKAFRLKPRGRHLIRVCLGTACHVRGGSRIVEQIGRILGIKPGETTDDLNFTLETVNCLGCCALGPVMVVDGEYYGKLTMDKVGKILKSYKKGKNDEIKFI
jgi:NADH-quinone oxidoreductase subunit E